MSQGRGAGAEFAATLAVGAAAAAMLLLAAGQPWAESSVVTDGMPRVDVTVAGSDAVGWLRPLALVVLAGMAATLATSGWWRRLTGVVVAVAGVAVVAGTLRAGPAVDAAVRSAARDTAAGTEPAAVDAAVRTAAHGGWQWVGVAAALLVLAAGVAVTARGARWPAMGRRYDRAAAQPRAERPDDMDARTDAQDLWREMDEGRDPTR